MKDYLYINDVGLIRIPERNTKDEIINFYNTLSKNEFIEIFHENVIEIDNLFILNQTYSPPPEYSSEYL